MSLEEACRCIHTYLGTGLIERVGNTAGEALPRCHCEASKGVGPKLVRDDDVVPI